LVAAPHRFGACIVPVAHIGHIASQLFE